MLRVAAKQSVARVVTQSIRHESGPPVSAPRPAGFGKKLFGFTLVTGSAAAIGIVGYSFIDPEFRRTVEDYVPQSKELLKTIIGPAE
jgi:hypothetical protein